jgi:hypothetical protein
LLSGRDPSTFPSAISANFFYIIKINNAHTAEDSWSKDTEQYEEIKISKILRLPTAAAAARSHLAGLSGQIKSGQCICQSARNFVIGRGRYVQARNGYNLSQHERTRRIKFFDLV